MAPSAQAHKRAHSLLLFEKLLNLRDSASPLTLVLDTLEQSAQPLTHEFMRRAKVSARTWVERKNLKVGHSLMHSILA
jgi:elongator complex protein 5